jgi:BirA family transcriptional regulator, biotin operon repressor / biotin---[acetyl-CoA-carboxylase] ligase
MSVTSQPTLGRPRLHLRVTDSTSNRARALADAGAPHGTLVTASTQTAGRGRHGRTWSAPPGSSILMSVVLRAPPVLLPLAAAIAVCDAIDQGTLIKWPNDVVLPPEGPDGRSQQPPPKVAGVLAEGRPQAGWAVLGIGVNVAVRVEDLPPVLRPGADARDHEESPAQPAATLGRDPAEIEPLLARLLDALALRLAEPAEATLAAWGERDVLRGREISWEGGRGRAEGVDGLGRLVVALSEGGQTTLKAGEVRVRPSH